MEVCFGGFSRTVPHDRLHHPRGELPVGERAERMADFVDLLRLQAGVQPRPLRRVQQGHAIPRPSVQVDEKTVVRHGTHFLRAGFQYRRAEFLRFTDDPGKHAVYRYVMFDTPFVHSGQYFSILRRQ